jgi:heterodisulfide reductase subunit B
VKLGYYPGCSLHATGREMDESTRAVAAELGVELDEVKDWSCCGASSAHATSHLLALALPARNLALAEERGIERVMAPCAACYSRLAAARHHAAHDRELAAKLREVLGRDFENRVEVMNVVELLQNLIPDIRAKLVTPLAGLKVACYYGCLLVRPAEVVHFDNPDDPRSMEEVVAAIGATPVAWSRRLECCGGGFSMARTKSVVRLGRALLEDALAAGADVVAVACPMCQSNLDLRQAAMSRKGGERLHLPIVYLTQLVGLALGVEAGPLGLGRHFVSTEKIVDRVEAGRKELPPHPPEGKG